MIRTRIFRSFVFLMIGFSLVACDKTPPNGNNNNNSKAPVTGTLEVEFRIPGSFLPPNRVLRADLSVAVDAEHLYKGHFFYVANVYNNKLMYQITLKPGNYYYQAGIVCIAGGDSCSAAGFPGGQFGVKWAIGTAQINANEITHVVPQFTQ